MANFLEKLYQKRLIFQDLRDLLDPKKGETTEFAQLKAKISSLELPEVLRTLLKRLVIEKTETVFTLQPMIREYVLKRLHN